MEIMHSLVDSLHKFRRNIGWFFPAEEGGERGRRRDKARETDGETKRERQTERQRQRQRQRGERERREGEKESHRERVIRDEGINKDYAEETSFLTTCGRLMKSREL